MEKVYIQQALGFEDNFYSNHVFKLEKSLYGLKQAPRAWYECLSKILIEKGFQRGKVNTALFIKEKREEILLVQVYVDDIIFGSINPNHYQEFSNLMKGEFEMSMMGELTYFLWLQIKQCKNRTFLNQAKYTLELLKRFDVSNFKPFATSMSPSLKLDSNPNGKKAV